MIWSTPKVMFGFGQRQMQRKKTKDRRIQDKREPYCPSIPVKVDRLNRG